MRRALSLSPPHPPVQRVEADPVDKLGRPLDIPDREVAPFAGLERAGLAENTSVPCSISTLPIVLRRAFLLRSILP